MPRRKTGIDYGNRLRILRRLNRLTQTQLAIKTGLSLGTIQKIEMGHSEPDVSTLIVLDEALGQKLETLDLLAADTPVAGATP